MEDEDFEEIFFREDGELHPESDDLLVGLEGVEEEEEEEETFFEGEPLELDFSVKNVSTSWSASFSALSE